MQSVPITTNSQGVPIPLMRGVLGTTLCDKVCQWFVAWWMSSTNKTDCHDIAGLLLQVALNTIPHNYLSIGSLSSPEKLDSKIAIIGCIVYNTLTQAKNIENESVNT